MTLSEIQALGTQPGPAIIYATDNGWHYLIREGQDGSTALRVMVANAASNDGSGTVTALAETNLASGTNGTFEVFSSGTTGTFTATREAVFENTGASDYINLNVSDDGASTSVNVTITDMSQK